MEKFKKEKKLPEYVDLAAIMGLKSKSTISEILGQRQNIQPEQWDKFKRHFKIPTNPDGSDISVSRETISFKGVYISGESMAERVIRIEASANILLITLAEMVAKTGKKSIATVYGELKKAVDQEVNRLLAELRT